MTTIALANPSAHAEHLVPFRPQDFEGYAAVVLTPEAKNIVKVNGRDRLEVVARLTAFETREAIVQCAPLVEDARVVTWGRIGSTLNSALLHRTSVVGQIRRGAETAAGNRHWTLVDIADTALIDRVARAVTA